MHCAAASAAAAPGPGWQCAPTGSGALAFAIVEASRDYLGRIEALYPHQVLGLVRSGDHYYLLNARDVEWGDRTRLKLLTLRLQAGLASSVEMTSSTALAPNAAVSSSQTIAAPARATAVDRPALGVAPGGAPPQGGYVCLATSRAQREGLTRLPSGDVVLAAGQSVHLVNPQETEIAIEVKAAPGRSLNLGEIFQRSARAGIYAGLVGQGRQPGAATTLERPDGTLTFRTASTGGSAVEPRVATVQGEGREDPRPAAPIAAAAVQPSLEPVRKAPVTIATVEPSLPPAPAPEKVAAIEPPLEPAVAAQSEPKPAIVTVAVTPVPPLERAEPVPAVAVPAPVATVVPPAPSVPAPVVAEPAAPRPAVVVAMAPAPSVSAPVSRVPAVVPANPAGIATTQPYDDYASAMKTLMALKRSGSVRSVSEMTYVHPAVEILRQQR
jgi:hypothetical protein